MKTTISIAVLLLALFTTIFTESNLLAASNAGRNFTVCFPKNFLNNDDAESKYAQLWLYIAAADTMSSKGNIYFYQNNKKETITFTVEKDSMIVIEIPKNLEILSDSIIEKKSISIVSDFNITVFGLSYDYATSDGFMAMPDIALDTSYIVASFGSKAVTGPNANLLYRYSGGVVIAALEDNTIVHVKSPAKFKNPVSEPYQDVTLFLNAGETRYLRAVDTLLMDVTGTIIHANKKISVFSTHQRVSIPNNTNGLTTNVLIEQTQPISILGNSIICTPHKSPSSKLKTLIRIIVPFDSTFIKVKNTVELLNAGTFKELFIIDTAEIIETSKPVLVAQYEQSSFINSKNEKIGEPFFLFCSANPAIYYFLYFHFSTN